ncbi:hypothetical protein ACSNN7_25850 [Micromonospora sp. URMC 105]|uniref:hypothetical protein n=1 Tax=Micromonospora sp. URMC 105 TaxID=3423413 RepID=UPI003F1C7EA3
MVVPVAAAGALSVAGLGSGVGGAVPSLAPLVDRAVCRVLGALRLRVLPPAGVSRVTVVASSVGRVSSSRPVRGPAFPAAPVSVGLVSGAPVSLALVSLALVSGGVAAPAAFLVAPACRGSGCSGSGGWNKTGAAFAGRRFADGEPVPSGRPAPAALAEVGGGVKVAFGERRRTPAEGSRRGGSLGVCSCMSMERSRERDGAHGENT